ncbi:MAG: hypothetical protein LUE97_07040 [Oscillospiraceae bacterium]|nr:hypothetical protein [Oscillospiraceae bacterium]
MGRKYNYEIVVNERPQSDYNCIFDYGHVKGIRLVMSRDKLLISYELTSKKDLFTLFCDRNNLVSEAMKKGMLFHFLHYSQAINVETVTASIDDKTETLKNVKIWSLVNGELAREFPDAWKSAEAVHNYFLTRHKSKQGYLAAALYALAYSKYMQFEIQRFMYLWVAMNGLYNHFSYYIVKKAQGQKEGKGKLPSERDKMENILQAEGLGTYMYSQKEQQQTAQKVDKLLVRHNYDKEGVTESLKQVIESYKDKRAKISAAGYLLLCYPYHLRCNLFHANKPMMFFAMENEFEIKRLQFVNSILEQFLDNNLLLYFDEEYCKSKVELVNNQKA